MDADTPHAQPGDAVDKQGVGVSPIDSTDPEEDEDPSDEAARRLQAIARQGSVDA